MISRIVSDISPIRDDPKDIFFALDSQITLFNSRRPLLKISYLYCLEGYRANEY